MMVMFTNFMGQINSLMMAHYPMSSPFAYVPTDFASTDYTTHSSPLPSYSLASNQYETDSNPTTSAANN